MVPILFNKKGELNDLTPGGLREMIISISKEHHTQKRAMAFAFIMSDFENPQINKVLRDFDYWKALDEISGKYLSIFHINTKDEVFAEDFSRFNGMVTKGLYNSGISSSMMVKLKFFIDPDVDLSLPCILFFQTDGRIITDYIVVELKEDSIENSFLEMKDYIKSAVESLSKITDENKQNYGPIFNLIRQNVEGRKLKRIVSIKAQSFPLNILISWLVGKV